MCIISIIVSVFNASKYLRRCLDSIRSQTFEHFEAILVNDASTDDSGKICDEYARLDSRFRVIHLSTNHGVSATRNIALGSVLGQYVGFVDADDYIHPQMYETLFRNISKNNYDIAICNFAKTESDHFDFEPVHANLNCHELSSDGYVLGMYWGLYYVVNWNKLYKKDFIDGLTFDHKGYAQDLFFNVQVFKRKPRVICCDFIGYAYFQNSASVVHTNRDEKDIEWMNHKLMIYNDVNGICESNHARFTLLSQMMLMAVNLNSKKFPPYLEGKKKEVIDRYKNEIRPLLLNFETHSMSASLKKQVIGKMLDYPQCAHLLMTVYLRLRLLSRRLI